MQKLLNEPARYVDEMLQGLVLAHPGEIRALESEPRAIVRVGAATRGRVAIATGGGSGHLPLFVGYVVNGLVDGCAVGNIFASPSAEQMFAVTEAIHSGPGVLYLYGNYGGDRLNFDEAADQASELGISVKTVLGADDVASAPAERASERRGIAGIYFGYRVAAAAARAGLDLDGVASITQRVLARTRSMGVALAPCVLPTTGRANFTLDEGQMEIGMGIHGEPGVSRGRLATADTVAEVLVGRLLGELRMPSGARVAVLINGLGATPLEELYILFRRTHQLLAEAGIGLHRAFVGEYATSMEMAGASISVVHLDDELAAYLDAGARSK